jgi:hypothetical protein
MRGQTFTGCCGDGVTQANATYRSELAKKPNAPLVIWLYALSFTTFASKLAPTGGIGFRNGLCGVIRSVD